MKTVDDYEYKDIIIPIPQNTAELKITAMVYEDSEISKLEGVFNLNDINECEKNFKDCLIGEYPRYTLTDEGKEYLEYLKSTGQI